MDMRPPFVREEAISLKSQPAEEAIARLAIEKLFFKGLVVYQASCPTCGVHQSEPASLQAAIDWCHQHAEASCRACIQQPA
jgi:hypothetical protein